MWWSSVMTALVAVMALVSAAQVAGAQETESPAETPVPVHFTVRVEWRGGTLPGFLVQNMSGESWWIPREDGTWSEVAPGTSAPLSGELRVFDGPDGKEVGSFRVEIATPTPTPAATPTPRKTRVPTQTAVTPTRIPVMGEDDGLPIISPIRIWPP